MTTTAIAVTDAVALLRSRVGSSFDDEATFSGEEVEQIVAALSLQGAEPVAYRHRLRGAEAWAFSSHDDMQAARDYQRLYPNNIEIEPLFTAPPTAKRGDVDTPAPENHVVDSVITLREAAQALVDARQNGLAHVGYRLDLWNALEATLAPEPAR